MAIILQIVPAQAGLVERVVYNQQEELREIVCLALVEGSRGDLDVKPMSIDSKGKIGFVGVDRGFNGIFRRGK